MSYFKYGLLIFSFLLVSVTSAFADKYPKNLKVDVLNYLFNIDLSDTSDEIKVDMTVDVRYLGAGVDYLRLDLTKASAALENKGMTVHQVKLGEHKLVFTHEDDALKIKLPVVSTMNQRAQYTITYSGIPATGLKIANNKHGDRTFFSDNWPDKARNWLAVVDHPYDKATSEFVVTAPDHYQVVSNGLRVEETNLGNGNRLTHWKQSIPIASWLYVLGVAEFAMQHVDNFEGKAIETWVYRQDRDAGFYDFAEPTKKALEFYSDYVGPFSYEKLANIQSNSVSGGMEAASAILYSEGSVVGDRNERWRNVVIHEIAHQWFGNAVTEHDWDDVWLSEGFATYFTSLFIEHHYGQDAFKEQMSSSKKRVDSFHAENPGYTIIHDNLEDMSKVTTSQTYHKGSWVLHMLRGQLGNEVFWKGIRNYYAKYQDLNATTADFRREMEEVSGMDLGAFFEQWLYKPGALILDGSWTYDKNKKAVNISLNQTQEDGSLFEMPIQVAIYQSEDKKPLLATFTIDKEKNTLSLPVDFEPTKVLLDPDSWVLMESTFQKKK
ncbi:peptidase M1-like protein [Algoriphagus ratkowskyi]|uniref:Aminopeptidase N n=1 Tax=Algoriphagus ratkowskyi TaxID=57028 RepID=A0A2W7RHS7_9BACT|nr:M1 family metallopeptidase [Algoriphagus ratkowskyi]PZX60458.1 peptidase M1-like protein [Algoriphagus ratkowskyi]TXD78263.1 M1 family metallopeptidase [Algoriphagus ratkowskyi]